jgi:hypothetical protein
MSFDHPEPNVKRFANYKLDGKTSKRRRGKGGVLTSEPGGNHVRNEFEARREYYSTFSPFHLAFSPTF